MKTTILASLALAFSLVASSVAGTALRITLDTNFTAKTVVTRTIRVTVATCVLDASRSEEDVRVTSLPLFFSKRNAESFNCVVYNAGEPTSVPITVVIAAPAEGEVNFTFSRPVIISRGTQTTLSLRCDTSGVGSFAWGLKDFSAQYTGAVGVESGNLVEETFVPSDGAIITVVSSGKLGVVTAPTSPNIAFTGTNATIYTMRAQGSLEPIELKTVAFDLHGVMDICSKITELQLFQGSVRIGGPSPIFGSKDAGTVQFILADGVSIPRDSWIELVLEANLSDELQTGDKFGVGIAQFALSPPVTGVGVESGVVLGSWGGGQEVEVQGIQGRIIDFTIRKYPKLVFSFNLRFHPLHMYHIEKSSDFSHWEQFAQFRFGNPTGALIVLGFEEVLRPKQFFRLVLAD